MEAISDAIDVVESFFYGDPCAGDEPVDATHRVITTNIHGIQTYQRRKQETENTDTLFLSQSRNEPRNQNSFFC